MRVVQLGPMPPPHGGVSTNLKAIHDLLMSRGHDASILAITSSSSVESGANMYKPRSAFQLLRLLLTLEFDIVHFHIGGDFNLRLAVLTLLCGILPRKKSVVTFHSGGYASKAQAFAKKISIRGIAFRSIDFLIGVNSQMIDMFRAYGVSEEKMRLILPFALSRPDPKYEIGSNLIGFIDKHQPFVLSIGGLEPEYSHSVAIDAMTKVVSKLPDAGLMIVGSGSIENELKEQINVKGLSDKVLLVNDIEHAAVLHLIEKADLMLRLTQYDGDAISVREGLFLRRPLIATDNGMRPDGVILVALRPTADEVADTIAEIIAGRQPINVPAEADGMENIEAVLTVYENLIAK